MQTLKRYSKPDYNYVFDRKTGFFARWGATKDEDPEFSQYGNEILDIEISTICHQGCTFCYKSNTKIGKNMSFETFKIILDKMPDTLTQIALGIGDIDGNPDLLGILAYSNFKGIIPNITVNGSRMTPKWFRMLNDLCGAVAVSHYNDQDCFNTVKGLSNRGLKQVNIHALLSHETFEKCMDLMKKTKTDSRLEKLNAIVFLWLKPKGDRNINSQISQEQYEELVDYAITNNIRFGFDSCSAPMFVDTYMKHPQFNEKVIEMVEPCESTLFSYYVDVDGKGLPCSFSPDIVEAIDVVAAEDFLIDVWKHPTTEAFRYKNITSKDGNDCRNCVIYNLDYNKDVILL